MKVEKDGYAASFYPGFVRRLAVRKGDTETELYLQNEKEPFYLPPGYDKPWPTSVLEFSAPSGARILLQIGDPGQQIGSIEVRFKGPAAAQPEGGLVKRAAGAVDALLGEDPPCFEADLVLVIEDAPVLCPPACPT